jgi:hypothetical protein
MSKSLVFLGVARMAMTARKDSGDHRGLPRGASMVDQSACDVYASVSGVTVGKDTCGTLKKKTQFCAYACNSHMRESIVCSGTVNEI